MLTDKKRTCHWVKCNLFEIYSVVIRRKRNHPSANHVLWEKQEWKQNTNGATVGSDLCDDSRSHLPLQSENLDSRYTTTKKQQTIIKYTGNDIFCICKIVFPDIARETDYIFCVKKMDQQLKTVIWNRLIRQEHFQCWHAPKCRRLGEKPSLEFD